MANLGNSLSCEVRIIEAKNLNFIRTGNLFVRCYLSTSNNEKIRLNCREIPTTSHPYWNDSISLECSATNDDKNCLEELKQQSVVFELRWRNNSPIIGKIGGSKVLGKAVISWKEVLESPELAIQKWVSTVSSASRDVIEGLKPKPPPALHVGLKVRIPTSMAAEMVKRRKEVELQRWWNKCGCRDGSCSKYYNCGDDELFALAAAIEAL
ncbi:uncharacterized protein LOC122648402 [Telopea speciosissima]|uniref:uncharacterized protein LOC122648402 n=1 Tax=Telopea speciosissima TaxID=54955 RepID=UPI001CC5A20E|nr:uncharacterized protein LOC122648402 [Telopea speciosissima]